MGEQVNAEELRAEVSLSIERQKPTERLGSQLLAICESAIRIHGMGLTKDGRDTARSNAVYRGIAELPRIEADWPPTAVFNYFFTRAVRSVQNERRRTAREARKIARFIGELSPDRHYSRKGP